MIFLHVSVCAANVYLEEDKHTAGSQLPWEQCWDVTKAVKDGVTGVLELVSYFQEDAP